MVHFIDSQAEIKVLDLNFMGFPNTIAVYLIKHPRGAVLIESGPGSTIQNLTEQLALNKLTPADITDVFLTHIHLDHAGAAGWLARQGARIHVHPLGASHLIAPEKLLASATRVYGNMMQQLWGDFLPVPENKMSILNDGDIIEIENIRLLVMDTPGHANHHFVYFYNDVCFSGDICGVRLPGPPYLSIPMPPPEFNLELWRNSLYRILQVNFTRLAPTHYGIFDDRNWHLTNLGKLLDEVEIWMASIMPGDPSIEIINHHYTEWIKQRAKLAGIDASLLSAYEIANPSWMSSQGMYRYWHKFRSAGTMMS